MITKKGGIGSLEWVLRDAVEGGEDESDAVMIRTL